MRFLRAAKHVGQPYLITIKNKNKKKEKKTKKKKKKIALRCHKDAFQGRGWSLSSSLRHFSSADQTAPPPQSLLERKSLHRKRSKRDLLAACHTLVESCETWHIHCLQHAEQLRLACDTASEASLEKERRKEKVKKKKKKRAKTPGSCSYPAVSACVTASFCSYPAPSRA
jgi:hypothetical protein